MSRVATHKIWTPLMLDSALTAARSRELGRLGIWTHLMLDSALTAARSWGARENDERPGWEAGAFGRDGGGRVAYGATGWPMKLL